MKGYDVINQTTWSYGPQTIKNPTFGLLSEKKVKIPGNGWLNWMETTEKETKSTSSSLAMQAFKAKNNDAGKYILRGTESEPQPNKKYLEHCHVASLYKYWNL